MLLIVSHDKQVGRDTHTSPNTVRAVSLALAIMNYCLGFFGVFFSFAKLPSCLCGAISP